MPQSPSDPQPSAKSLKTGWASAESCETQASGGGLFVSSGFDWRSFDAYLFDIDGTLLNSRDAVHYFAFHGAIKRIFGRDFSVEGVPVHGNTDIGILRAYMKLANVPDSEWQPRIPEVIAHMCEEVERNAADLRPELCPSIREIVGELHSARKLLGAASGNLERVGWAKLRAAGLRDYFSFGSFSDQRELRDDIIAAGVEHARKQLGSAARVVVVGDTPADIASARANSVPVLAVATGIYSYDELLKHQPEMCVGCAADLP